MVEKPGKIATVTPLGKGDTYNDEVFMFNKPEYDKDIKVEEYED